MNTPPSNEMTARPASLSRACAVLAMILLALLPGFAAYGYYFHAMVGILAALVACGICLTCGILALCTTAIAQKMGQGIQGVFAAMLVRMSVPVIALLALPKIGGPLVAAGITGMVMAYYLLTLAAETWLSLRFVPVTRNAGSKNPAAKVA